MNSSGATAHQTSHAAGDIHAPPKQTSFVPNLKMNDGHEIPMLAYGLGTANGKSSGDSNIDKELVKTVVMAINADFHHLDGAESYGNEPELGRAITDAGVPREKLFVVTKYASKIEDTRAAFDQSLEKLGLDYVDLYLIHSPFTLQTPAKLQKAWADMEAIHASGKARSIGVSNFYKPHLEAILQTAKIIPAINQLEFHPYLQHTELIEFNKQHGIATSAYAPLTAITRAAPGPVDDTYAQLAHKYGVTPGEIALRWVIDQGIVAITTSSSEQRLRGYQKIAKFKLTPKEVETIAEEGKKKNFRGFWKNKFDKDDWS